MKCSIITIALLTLITTSCKKDYKCRCMSTTTSTVIDGAEYKDVTTTESFELVVKGTNKKSVKGGICSSIHKESSIDGQPVITDRTCTINTN